MKKIYFKNEMQLYGVDYGHGRVSSKLNLAIKPGHSVYLVGHFDKGVLIDTEPQLTEQSNAVYCNEDDYIIMDS